MNEYPSAPFPHQVEGMGYLINRKRAYLGDPPGFGKTRIAVEAARHIGARALVVCPAIVRTHWDREFRRWDQYGGQNNRSPLILSYDGATRGGYGLMAELLGADAAPNLLILDEAHYLKHPTAQRTRMLLGKNGYARRMEYVWALSGTPTPKNNPLEYWTILVAMFPKLALEYDVKTVDEFSDRFCITKPTLVRGRMVPKVIGIKNPQTLVELMGRTMLRRSPAELSFKMPPVFKQFLEVDLQMDVEEPEGSDYADRFDAATLLADPELARYRHNVGDAKVAPVLEILRSQLAGSTEKVVVFAHHRSVLRELRNGLEEFGVAYIDGDTPQPNRAAAVDTFQSSAQCRVFLGQTQACHTGITLTAAHRVVLVEPDWTDAVNTQAAGRVARIGQKEETCIVQYVVAANTLDEGIIRSLAREAGMGETLYGA